MADTDIPIQTWRYDAGSGVAAVGISGDGETIIVGTLGKTVLSLDGQGQLRWQAEVGNQAWRVGLSNDGQSSVVGTGSTRPWDRKGRGLYCFARDGSLRWQVELNASVWGLALSANGQTVAVGTSSKQLFCFDYQGHRLWQQDTSDLTWYDQAKWRTIIWSTALSADGQTIVAGAVNKKVGIFKRNGMHIANLQVRSEVFTVAISANGEAVTAGDGANYVYYFDQRGHLLWEEQLVDKIWAAVLSTDGQRLLVGAGEKEKHLYAYDQSGRLLWKRFVDGSIIDIALSANGRRIVAGTRNGGVHIFGEDGDVLHKAQADKLVRRVAISATGERIVVGSEDGYIYGFQLPPPAPETPVSTSQPEIPPQPTGTVYNIKIEHAAGLAIGDKAQVTQGSVGKSVPEIQPGTNADQRCVDLAGNIRETWSLIKLYEEKRRLSSDPKEKTRAEREIADLREQLLAYETEARELGCG